MCECIFNVFLNRFKYLKKRSVMSLIVRLDLQNACLVFFLFSQPKSCAHVQWAAQLVSHHYLISEEFSAGHAFGAGFMSYPTP